MKLVTAKLLRDFSTDTSQNKILLHCKNPGVKPGFLLFVSAGIFFLYAEKHSENTAYNLRTFYYNNFHKKCPLCFAERYSAGNKRQSEKNNNVFRWENKRHNKPKPQRYKNYPLFIALPAHKNAPANVFSIHYTPGTVLCYNCVSITIKVPFSTEITPFSAVISLLTPKSSKGDKL